MPATRRRRPRRTRLGVGPKELRMSIRQTINEKPAIGIGIGAGILVIALILILIQTVGSRSSSNAGGPVMTEQEFFSDDDGQSYFVDSRSKLPPFKHNGKDAYVANVFRC